jgi:hypothetical protein
VFARGITRVREIKVPDDPMIGRFSWEYPGNQTAEIPKTGGNGKDEGCLLSCPNVTDGHWLDRLNPIPNLDVGQEAHT